MQVSMNQENHEVTIHAVFYVDSPDIEVGHIAIRPTFSLHKAKWEDTSAHGMIVHLAQSSFNVEEYKKQPSVLPEKIVLISRDTETFTLQPLTLELYNEKIRDRAVGNKKFASTEELQKFYLDQDFMRYKA